MGIVISVQSTIFLCKHSSKVLNNVGKGEHLEVFPYKWSIWRLQPEFPHCGHPRHVIPFPWKLTFCLKWPLQWNQLILKIWKQDIHFCYYYNNRASSVKTCYKKDEIELLSNYETWNRILQKETNWFLFLRTIHSFDLILILISNKLTALNILK